MKFQYISHPESDCVINTNRLACTLFEDRKTYLIFVNIAEDDELN